MAKAKVKEQTSNPTNENLLFITKVKIKDNKADIAYKKSNSSYAEEINHKGTEEVQNKFAEKLLENISAFIKIIPEFAKSQKKIEINSIQFYYGNDNYLQSVIFSVKYFFNPSNKAVININTPKIPIYREDTACDVCVQGEDEERLHETLALAKEYLNGATRRTQLKLIED